MNQTFQKWAQTAQKMGETSRVGSKNALCGEYFASIPSGRELALAARFFVEGPFPAVSGRRVVIGSRTYSTCAADFCEIDYEKVFKPCKKALRDTPEAIEKLMRNIDAARQKRSPAGLSLAEIERIYESLTLVTSRADKQQILRKTWEKMTALEIKYFIRIMVSGPLKIGIQAEDIVAALSDAFGQPVSALQYVYTITGSIGQTAALTKDDQLSTANFALFHPIPLMLAKPGQPPEKHDFKDYVVEEIFDGLRAQIHIQGDKVTIYSRERKEITDRFPKIAAFFANRNLPALVLDGEICLYKKDEILPAQYLRERLRTRKSFRNNLKSVTPIFIAFDLLFYNHEIFLKEELTERRNRLLEIAKKYDFPISSEFECGSPEDVERLMNRSPANGSKGLIFKDKRSVYQYGKRSQSWLKLKRAGNTLMAILMYAHADTSQHGGAFKSFTMGIRVTDDDRYDEKFIPIGKVKIRPSNKLKRLNGQIKELKVEKFGPTVRLRPEVVVELEFDDIRVNKRTKANYVLRKPRLKTICWKSNPEATNTLKDVEEMLQDKLDRR